MEPTPPAETPPAAPRKKSRRDRYVKLGFALLFLGAIVVVVYIQLRGPTLGWPGDLEKVLARARSEGRAVVVFVRPFPVDETTKNMVSLTLSTARSRKELEEGNFLLAEVRMFSSAVRPYGVTRAPALLLIEPDGRKFHIHEGPIDEQGFCEFFLKRRSPGRSLTTYRLFTRRDPDGATRRGAGACILRRESRSLPLAAPSLNASPQRAQRPQRRTETCSR